MSTTIAERLAGGFPDLDLTEAGPRGRSSWSGLLRLSLVAIPVKAFAVHSTSAAIQFNQLHVNCGRRIQHQKRCPAHGPVEAAEIVRGYQYAPDQYVVVEPEELDKVRPAKDKALVLEQFIPVHQIDPVFFAGRSLYLLPDGLAARHPYGVIADALQRESKWALGRVVLSVNRQLVLVRPMGRLLVMDVLHYPSEVRMPAAWEADLRTGAATTEEVRLIRMLLEAGSAPLDWRRYRDVTADELTALIKAKVAGRRLAAPPEEPVEALHLLDALKQSVVVACKNAEAAKSKQRKPSSRKRAPA